MGDAPEQQSQAPADPTLARERERRRAWIGLILGLLVLSLAVDMLLIRKLRDGSPRVDPRSQRELFPRGPQLKVSGLEDQFGRSFRFSETPPRWSLVFFGFTRCPDICPPTMALLAEVWQRLDDAPAVREGARVVLVSIDPADDAASLRDFVAAFDPRFVGVHGPRAEVYGLAAQAGAWIGESAAELEHSGVILLVGPTGHLRGVFTPPLDADAIEAGLRRAVSGSDAS